MPFWTRLRPGPIPGLNAYCYDFPRRALSLKWRRQHSIILNEPPKPPPTLTQSLARKLANYVQWNDIHDQELPF